MLTSVKWGYLTLVAMMFKVSGSDGAHRGDWHFPDGTQLPFPSSTVNTYGARVSQRVHLRRNSSANSPTGIYHCDIPTNDVNDDTDISVRDTVCVELYTANGGTRMGMVFMELTFHYHEINV